jgi:hypothetical protein
MEKEGRLRLAGGCARRRCRGEHPRWRPWTRFQHPEQLVGRRVEGTKVALLLPGRLCP